jgi:hypothetical protein
LRAQKPSIHNDKLRKLESELGISVSLGRRGEPHDKAVAISGVNPGIYRQGKNGAPDMTIGPATAVDSCRFDCWSVDTPLTTEVFL